MILELSSKSSYTDADVQRVWEDIEARVTRVEAENAVDRAVEETKRTCGRHIGRAAYGWSGGKDSLALEVVMRGAGVQQGVLGIVAPLEWRGFLAWARDHKPGGIEVISNDLDERWLAQHRDKLFPADSKVGYFWTLAGTRHAQSAFIARHNPSVMIYGRRTADGNVCGDQRGIALSKEGAVYNPIRGWAHELVLAVIHYLWMPRWAPELRTLPPIYSAPDGWTSGTGPWAGRRFPTWDDGWASTYAIEPGAVHRAARTIPEAAAWLRTNERTRTS